MLPHWFRDDRGGRLGLRIEAATRVSGYQKEEQSEASMIKFFRRVRRKLIDEGNLKKYLIYAIGEIILVVVGILLALQINTWNEAGKENKQERELANNLYEELLDYQNYCNRFLTDSNEEISVDEFYLKNWQTLSLDKVQGYREEELRPFLKNLPIKTVFGGFQFYFDPKFPYYETALSDGTISILKDQEFVNHLDFIYAKGSKRMEAFYEGAGSAGGEMSRHVTNNYSDLFIKSDPAILGDWNELTYELFFNRVREDGKLKSLLENRYSSLQFKKFTVERQILPNIEKAIQHYEESKYFSTNGT